MDFKINTRTIDSINWGEGFEILMESLPEAIKSEVRLVLADVNILNFDFDLPELLKDLEFIDNGAFNAVFYNQNLFPNRVLKIPFANPLGKKEIMNSFKSLKRSNKSIGSILSGLDKTTEAIYRMNYMYHGGPFSIIHKVVAHNRHFVFNTGLQ